MSRFFSSSVVERSSRYLEGHGLDSRWGLGIFFSEKDLDIYLFISYLFVYLFQIFSKYWCFELENICKENYLQTINVSGLKILKMVR